MRTTSMEARLDLMLADLREYGCPPVCFYLPEELVGLLNLRAYPDTYRGVPLRAVPGKTLVLCGVGGTVSFEATCFSLAQPA